MRRCLSLAGKRPLETDEENASIHYYSAPSAAERQELMDKWRIDRHSLDAALDPDEVPRVDFSSKDASIFWKRPTSVRSDRQVLFNVASMGVFLRDDKMIVVVSDDHFPVGQQAFADVSTTSSFLLRLLGHTIQHYYEHLKVIKMISREMQNKLESSMEKRLLMDMFSLEESLTYYLNALESDGAVLRKLEVNPEKVGFTKEDLDYLDDLRIDHEQCQKLTKIYQEIMDSMVQTREGIMNNSMNVILKNLTIITLVFLPLNLLAGLGGMSEYSSALGGFHKGLGYALLIPLLGGIGWATWWMLARYVDDFNSGRKKSNRPKPKS